jgi:carbon-monoxide dehydrogenase small subunit
MSAKTIRIAVTVNGKIHTSEVEPRLLLADFLRHRLGLKGTHVGCEHGVCGACTVNIDGSTARSCLTFAAQVDGATVTTVEGLAKDGPLTALQEAFHCAHALQCGFCTPGFLMVLDEFLIQVPDPTDEQIVKALSGNLCRCTGYVNMVDAVRQVVRERREVQSACHKAG